MSHDQEELVSLIFGDNVPDNWRENPELCLYLSELGNMSVERIVSQPERVSSEFNIFYEDFSSKNFP